MRAICGLSGASQLYSCVTSLHISRVSVKYWMRLFAVAANYGAVRDGGGREARGTGPLIQVVLDPHSQPYIKTQGPQIPE